jgi:hypothetical protein
MEKKERGPKKIQVGCSRPDMYKAYIKRNKDKGERFDITYGKYAKVLNKYNKGIVHLILHTAMEYIIPYNLGTIRIRKYKPNVLDYKTNELRKGHLAPDWHTTLELWGENPKAKEEKKIVFHINDHTDGYRYRWYFRNYRSTCPNRTAYSFQASRTNKRKLAALLLDEDFEGDFYG